MSDKLQNIKNQYVSSQGDSTGLFREIMRVAEEIGMDEALTYLEQCVIEKRLSWLKANLGEIDEYARPVYKGYRLFYENYLGFSVPEDGEIVEASEKKIVTRWWNPCPTLEACKKLGLDTREICKKAYHRPVQVFLMQINPKLRFERNYEKIRPYEPFCEEIIFLDD